MAEVRCVPRRAGPGPVSTWWVVPAAGAVPQTPVITHSVVFTVCGVTSCI